MHSFVLCGGLVLANNGSRDAKITRSLVFFFPGWSMSIFKTVGNLPPVKNCQVS